MTNGTLRRVWRHIPWGVLGVVALVGALSVGRASPDAEAAPETPVYRMVFPLAGPHTLTDSFGDPRGRGRRHQGVDVLADRMTPVVAVAAGTVRWLHDERGGNCCDVALLHDDGWRSRYIHLNNDTPGTDDGRAVGIAPGLHRGTRVAAGQLIGWVGDSGNAESTVPHLHFELRRPDGTPIDPLPSLRAALAAGREVAPGAGGSPRLETPPTATPPTATPPTATPPTARRGETGGGLWRYLLGDGGTPEAAGAGSAEPPTARPAAPSHEAVPTAHHPPGSYPDLAMDRRVEEIPVPPREARPRREPSRGEPPRRRGDTLGCWGFAQRRPPPSRDH